MLKGKTFKFFSRPSVQFIFRYSLRNGNLILNGWGWANEERGELDKCWSMEIFYCNFLIFFYIKENGRPTF